MRTYIYSVINSSSRRGFNRTVVVYRMIRNVPIYVGINERINTSATPGDRGEAVQLIGHIECLKHGDYEFTSKNIQLFSV